MLCEIPSTWRSTVAAILRRARANEVLLKRRPRLDWEALTLNPHGVSLFHAIAEALTAPITNARRVEMDEPGECYEFVFKYAADHGTVSVYTKLSLQPSGQVVVIYSAHRPNKSDELTQ